MQPEAKLTELGLELPNPPAAGGNYLPFVRTGNLIYCAGTISVRDGEITHSGQVGAEQTVETGYESARICALNTLATLKSAVGSLSNIKRLIYVGGYVNAVSSFDNSPGVINGASDLFIEVLGEAGRHSRAAVAVAGLPKNSTVEIQVVAEAVE
ncbi:MAG: RidA family protein [Candidatus Synoicihabitans palmerolidicus]|nr:RidA family protein [Candidatus Synoicihabitans palmerolidicus]